MTVVSCGIERPAGFPLLPGVLSRQEAMLEVLEERTGMGDKVRLGVRVGAILEMIRKMRSGRQSNADT